MTILVGIDSGQKGAIAVLEFEANQQPKFISVIDMPTVTIKENGKSKTQINGSALNTMLNDILADASMQNKEIHFAIERIWAQAPRVGGRVMERQINITAIGNQMRDYGIILGLLTALQKPFTLYAPQTWKSKVLKGQATGSKDASVVRVQQLFPTAPVIGPRGAKLDGRADALCIAYMSWLDLRNGGATDVFRDAVRSALATSDEDHIEDMEDGE